MYKYKINVYPVETTEGIEWIARFPEVNNCGGSGITPEEAIKDAYDNLDFELSLLKEEGKPIPSHSEDNRCSGKFLLRMPKSLHAKIAKLADDENISINQYIIACLSENVGQVKAAYEIAPYAYEKGCDFILNKIDEISEIKMRQIPKVHDTFKNFFRLADAQQKQAEEQRDIFEKWNIENSLYHSVWRR